MTFSISFSLFRNLQEKGVKSIHGSQSRQEKDAIYFVLVSLMLTLNILHTFLNR